MTVGTVIIMVKAPVAGRVKTRLGADIGMARSAALFRTMTAQTIARAGAGPWRTIIAVEPFSAMEGYGNLWPTAFDRISQAKGDLGNRMREAMKAFPLGPVVIIGADALGLRSSHIRMAFSALRGADAVFGPAEDGGYWLIGLARRRGASSLFEDVRWSTKYALADTKKSLPARFTVAELPVLSDVDTIDDLPVRGLTMTV